MSSFRSTGSSSSSTAPTLSSTNFSPMTFNISSLCPHPVAKSNYLVWKNQLEGALRIHMLLPLISGTPNPEHEQHMMNDQIVLSWIKATPSTSLQTLILPCKTAYEAWAFLEKHVSPVASRPGSQGSFSYMDLNHQLLFGIQD